MKALAITATLVVLLLSLGIAVMAVVPSPQPGEQSVIVDVVPEGQDGAPANEGAAPGNDQRSSLDIPERPSSDTPGLTLAGGQSGDPDRYALPPAPIEDLIEHSEYGPLPKIGEDGKRPSEAYAARAPEDADPNQPRVAILIDGLGQADVITQVLLRMPPQIGIALGPYGQGLQGLGQERPAERA